MPPKVKSKRSKDAVKPLSGLDIDSLLGHERRLTISKENAIPEFKQMLASTEDFSGIENAVKQMSVIVCSLITNSFGDSGYGRAVEGLRVMREELMALEEPDLYNKFMKDLKKKILAGSLGGERRDMWWEVRKTRLGLIDNHRSEVSSVTEVEANEVRADFLEPGKAC